MATTDIAIVEPGGFVALNHPPSELLEPFVVNLGGDTLSKFDLDKATVPGPGGKRWRVTRADGSSDDPVSIRGIIVGLSNSRAYYREEYTGDGTPPDCASYDGGITGVGNPGGTCHDCPMNVFETARNGGRGKACAEGKHLLLLPENAVLPMLVTIPSVSLRFLKGYMQTLANSGIKYWRVVTELTISTTNTRARTDVVCALATKVGPLDPSEIPRVEEYKNALDGLLSAITPRSIADSGHSMVDSSADED